MFKSRWCCFFVSLLVCYLHFALFFFFSHSLCNSGVSCVFCIICVRIMLYRGLFFSCKKIFLRIYVILAEFQQLISNVLIFNLLNKTESNAPLEASNRVESLSECLSCPVVWRKECRTAKRSCS